MEAPEPMCGAPVAVARRRRGVGPARRRLRRGGLRQGFIYDLPSALYDLQWRPSPTPGATPRERLAPFASVEEVFGSEHVEKSRSCEGLDDHAFESLYATEQWGAAEQLLYRAATSGRCPRTLDPAEADIFLVPVLPKAKSGSGWVAACNATGADERSLVKALPHLNERTAHRHVMVVAKGLASAKTCDWFLEPRTLLKRAVRVAYSAKGKLGREAGSHRGATNGTFIVDKHYGAAVRARVVQICEAAPENFCHVDLIAYRERSKCFLGLGTTSFHPETMELAKAKSVFCLEPLGDSPYRKSIWDSLSLGCIPVVFSLYSEITAPWHWGPGATPRVYVPEARLNDDAFDLVDHLRSIPEADVKAMQATIAHHARSIQIAVDDVPHYAFETLVRRLVAEVEAHEASPGFPAPFDPGETGQWLDVGTH
ncbi:hypothetical protein JL722_12613 [Aureococcus anophagefferens]|nr:hypothetical protein JL722_12613 [Aureococcus anophagefferens]